MIPIRDHNPSGRTPYVVYLLMAANVLIFLSYVGVMNDARLINRILFDYAVIPARIMDGYGFQTLITSMFMHGGWMHLAGNLLFLWIFGDNLEEEMGHVPFLIFYLVSGIGAGLLHVFAAPASTVPTIGASGAIAGVMGGYFLLFPRARVDILLFLIIYIRVIPIPAFVMLGVWLGMQVLGGFGADPDQGGVAYWAHAGGFFVGLILCIPLWIRRGGPRYWRRTHGHPPHPAQEYEYSPSRIPRLPRKKNRGPWNP
ncbi:rhomboid family intramembrane serine protease [Ruegeria sediminis]|uniref:Rhomboid family intramembrane serine protease n=1 Tax=Ruegeria sediminis TaxID=2583820 RepID=A0ABY2WY16_9RHOB|nr:rhomboid family intramembrane serine protease [Ruegeria sediminis]TMV07764.1 rhomboid family intramembrane serine protease [Ruegeria sediminis]